MQEEQHNKQPEADASNLVALKAKTRQQELERIQRLTGLPFDQIPESLITEVNGRELSREDGEELVLRALHLWNDDETSDAAVKN